MEIFHLVKAERRYFHPPPSFKSHHPQGQGHRGLRTSFFSIHRLQFQCVCHYRCLSCLSRSLKILFKMEDVLCTVYFHPENSGKNVKSSVPASTLRPWNVPSTSLDPTLVKSKVDGNSTSHGCTFLDVVVTSEIYFKATSHLDIHAT